MDNLRGDIAVTTGFGVLTVLGMSLIGLGYYIFSKHFEIGKSVKTEKAKIIDAEIID